MRTGVLIFISLIPKPFFVGRFEAIPDDLTSQEILEQARQAAKAAADKLKLHKPSSQMGFIRQNKDGSTSLNFLIGNYLICFNLM